MAALGITLGLGLAPARIAEGLATFRGDHGDNPGRFNIYQGYPFTVVHDSAHNPHGMRVVCATLHGLPVKGRRIAVISGAGSRHGEQIAEMAEIMAAEFDFFICSRRGEHLSETEVTRSFPIEEVPQRLADALIARGVDRRRIEVIDRDTEAVDRGLALAQDGDLVALLTGMVGWTWDRMLAFGRQKSEA
jgi:UDP-N-acetylmuramyl tripeptide synthase